MNKEIKEILDSWKLGIEKGIDKNGIYVGGLCYSWEQLSFLLDYITNLQQENEKLKYQLNVQEDLTIKNIMRKHIYKSRCEKAIELYQNCKEEDWCTLPIDMINILQGSDSE